MDLRQLEYFQMVSRLNNITKAAERLNVAQPSITVSIKKLEDELGVMLFDRSQKKIILTAEGEVFLKRIEGVLTALKDAKIEMQDYQGIEKGIIKLGIPMMTGSYIFPKIFSGFRKSYPNIDFIITEEGSIGIQELLDQGQLDLGIMILQEESKLLDSIVIKEAEIVACLPLDHPLASLSKITIDDLRKEKFIMFKENTIHRQAVLDLFEKKGFYPEIIISSTQNETIHSLVANGMGVSFLLDFIAKKNQDMIGIPFEHPIKVKIVLAWKKNKYLSLASRAFIEYTKNLY